jgi:transketolase
MAALETKNAPSVLLFTRQDLPVLERPKNFVPEDVLKGAYVVVEAEKPEVVIVATGSEVWVAVDAAKQLGAKGKSVRVVSMPCAELFLKQSASYQATLIPRSAKRVLIEAGTTVGWERIVGCDALMLGINHFGASAPGGVLAEKFGFTPPVVVEKISQWLNA